MDFDQFTIALLVRRDDRPALSDDEAAALQDAHMAHIAELHATGRLLAAGPLADETFRGLSILRAGPEEARELKSADPAVQAGVYSLEVMPWMVPAGALSFAPARFPRSMAEAAAG